MAKSRSTACTECGDPTRAKAGVCVVCRRLADAPPRAGDPHRRLTLLDLHAANLDRLLEHSKLTDYSAIKYAADVGSMVGSVLGGHMTPAALADVLIALDLLFARLKISPTDAVIERFNAISDRIGSKVKL